MSWWVCCWVWRPLPLYPAILLPALWRPDDRRGRWTMPLARRSRWQPATYLRCDHGSEVLGFLPKYFGERFNMALDWRAHPCL